MKHCELCETGIKILVYFLGLQFARKEATHPVQEHTSTSVVGNFFLSGEGIPLLIQQMGAWQKELL